MKQSHYSALISLGLPIVIGQIGVIILGFADTLMVGHHSTRELAAASFVNNMFTLAIIFSTGFAYGLTPVVGSLFGQGKREEAGNALKNSLAANTVLAVVVCAVMFALYLNIGRLGQPEELLPFMRPYFLVLLASLPFVLWFNGFKQFTDGITDTKVSMWILLGGNLLNIVGNYYKPGPASEGKERRYFVDAYRDYEKDGVIYGDKYPELYLEGNYHTLGIDKGKYPDDVYWHHGGSGTLLSAPLSIKADDTQTCWTTTHPVQSAYTAVTGYAGASLVRDDVDERVTGNVLDGDYTCEGSNGSTGGIIDSQNDVGGWPEYSADTDNEANGKTDTDGDGIPDWFEEKFGLDTAADDADGMDIDIHGRYTNLEMYLHYLVRDIVAAQTEGGTYTSLG